MFESFECQMPDGGQMTLDLSKMGPEMIKGLAAKMLEAFKKLGSEDKAKVSEVAKKFTDTIMGGTKG